MINKSDVGNHLPDNGRVLLTCKNGIITSVRMVNGDEHIASLKGLIELAEMAGYTITKKAESNV